MLLAMEMSHAKNLLGSAFRFYFRNPIAVLLVAMYQMIYGALASMDGYWVIVFEFFVTGHILCALTLFKASNNTRSIPAALKEIWNFRSHYFIHAAILTGVLGALLAVAELVSLFGPAPGPDPGLANEGSVSPFLVALANAFLTGLLLLLLIAKWLMYRLFAVFALVRKSGPEAAMVLFMSIGEQYKHVSRGTILLVAVAAYGVAFLTSFAGGLLFGSMALMMILPVMLAEACFGEKDSYGASYV